MTEYEKARAVIVDRNNRLPEVSKKLNIPLPTLKMYRMHPDKLKTAYWENVHKISKLYKDNNYGEFKMTVQELQQSWDIDADTMLNYLDAIRVDFSALDDEQIEDMELTAKQVSDLLHEFVSDQYENVM